MPIRDDLCCVSVSGLAGLNQDDLRVDTPCLERPAYPLDDRDRGQVSVAEQHLDQRASARCVTELAARRPPERLMGWSERALLTGLGQRGCVRKRSRLRTSTSK